MRKQRAGRLYEGAVRFAYCQNRDLRRQLFGERRRCEARSCMCCSGRRRKVATVKESKIARRGSIEWSDIDDTAGRGGDRQRRRPRRRRAPAQRGGAASGYEGGARAVTARPLRL